MIKRLLQFSACFAMLAPVAVPAMASGETDALWQFCNRVQTDPVQAISACTTIIERGEPKDRLIAYNQRGRAYLYRNWNQNALADFNEVLKIDPNFADGYNNRAVAYRALGRFQEAMTDHDRAMSMAKKPIYTQARDNTLKAMAKQK